MPQDTLINANGDGANSGAQEAYPNQNILPAVQTISISELMENTLGSVDPTQVEIPMQIGSKTYKVSLQALADYLSL